jgi:sugar phosphate isomerase/epimerase
MDGGRSKGDERKANEMIRIGTCVKGEDFYSELPKVRACGFESVQLYFPSSLSGFKIEETGRIRDYLAKNDIEMNAIGLYCNPIQDASGREEIAKCIECCPKLGVTVVGAFAGAVDGAPVEAALPRFKECFSELVSIAKDNGVKIGIENYPAYGFWYGAKSNIGFCPRAWEMMFNEIDDDALGLEWEPSHQVEQFIDPIPQLREWAGKIVHVHGKDCHIDAARLRTAGILSCLGYSVHRFPGLGDTDWKNVFGVLEEEGYRGAVTVEGFHDPEYYGDRELEGQRLALCYLRKCREG